MGTMNRWFPWSAESAKEGGPGMPNSQPLTINGSFRLCAATHMTPQNKALTQNLQAHDLAENLRLRRAKWAKEAGLDPTQFALPFPGNQTVAPVTHNYNYRGMSTLGKLAVAGGIGLATIAGAGGTLGLMSLLKSPPAATAPTPPSVNTTNGFDIDFPPAK